MLFWPYKSLRSILSWKSWDSLETLTDGLDASSLYMRLYVMSLPSWPASGHSDNTHGYIILHSDFNVIFALTSHSMNLTLCFSEISKKVSPKFFTDHHVLTNKLWVQTFVSRTLLKNESDNSIIYCHKSVTLKLLFMKY